MKKVLYVLCILANLYDLKSQVTAADSHTPAFKTGNEVLAYIHQKYKSGPCKAYTFSQKNKHYRNDSVIGTSEWFESIEFPDKFRIEFGTKAAGNFVIFKNDSSYRYKNNTLVKTKYDANILLLLLGGMYYRSLEDITKRLHDQNFNTEVLSSQSYHTQLFYVIGAQSGDSISNQIWVDKNTWRVFRIIEKMENGHLMNMTFDAHQKHCNGYVETKVTFRDNGDIEQVEDYYDIKAVDNFPKEIFSPGK